MFIAVLAGLEPSPSPEFWLPDGADRQAETPEPTPEETVSAVEEERSASFSRTAILVLALIVVFSVLLILYNLYRRRRASRFQGLPTIGGPLPPGSQFTSVPAGTNSLYPDGPPPHPQGDVFDTSPAPQGYPNAYQQNQPNYPVRY